MSYPTYQVPAGDVLPVMFTSYAGSTGASVTLTGLAVTDIEIYKDGSVTQRASDAGYTLLDTDGIDFDAITGIHGFSIDTGDNTDAGFYTVGAWFTVVVSAVTIDAQTVNFIACQFRLMAAEAIAGKPKTDVDGWLGTACATPTVAGVPEVDLTHVAGATTNVAALATNVDAILADTADMQPKLGTPAGASISADLLVIDNFVDGIESTLAAGVTLAAVTHTGAVIPTVTTTTTATNVTTVNGLAANVITAASMAADAGAEIADAVWDEAIAGHLGAGSTGAALNAAGSAGDPWSTAIPGAYGAGTAGKILGDNINATISSRASQTSVDTVDDLLDTEVAAIKTVVDAILVDTDVIGATGAGLTSLATQASVNTIDDFLDTEIAAIKAKTDSLTFTVAGQVDANMLAITGDTGSATKLERVLSGNTTGTVGAASTTTSIVTSSLNPAASVTDQFKGLILKFDDATTTAALRGQGTDITASTAAGVLTCTALTTAPVSGDTFTVS